MFAQLSPWIAGVLGFVFKLYYAAGAQTAREITTKPKGMCSKAARWKTCAKQLGGNMCLHNNQNGLGNNVGPNIRPSNVRALLTWGKTLPSQFGDFFGDGLKQTCVRVGRIFSTSSISSLVHFRCLSLELSACALPRVSCCMLL